NYHVFYYLLLGASEEERTEFKLLPPEEYSYLKQGFTFNLHVCPSQVKEELLVEALTKRKTVTVNDKLILPYSHSEAITARDSMAKSLYGALFDWIVLRINHALLNKKDMEESKNTDHMRPDIVALLRSSDRAFVRQLIGMDPVAMFRWGILRATIRGLAAFNEAGRSWGVIRPASRTPLGELQRSNAPIERMYNHPYPPHLSVTPVYVVLSSSSSLHRRASMLDFYFDHSEERPLEAFEDIFASYENKK
ncbi:hypothetical protein GOODEAATRI_004234, partial [Goodea atripinnis]